MALTSSTLNKCAHEKAAPKFSVVIPAYNASLYIVDCLNSVFAQTESDYEIIVVDDGSTDDTRERVLSFTDSRLKLISRPNGGLAAARNTGVAVAEGELVAFLDADDRWLPDKLAAHRLANDTCPEVSVTYDWAAFIDSEGESTGLCMSQSNRKITHKALMIKNYLGNGSNSVVRRKVLEELKGFDEKLFRLVDRELWVRLTYYGHKFQLVPKVLTEYRQHSSSFTSDTARMLKGLDEFFSRIALYAPESVEKYSPLARACMHRWMARAALVDRNYEDAQHHMYQSLGASLEVIWSDPRAPITFVAIFLQSILPSQWFDKLLKISTSLVSRWFQLRISS